MKRSPMTALAAASVFIVTWAYASFCAGAAGLAQHDGFPRILGMNIGGPIYYADPLVQRSLAKADVVILGFYRGWERDQKPHTIKEVLGNLRRLNPKILIGQYTILQESQEKGPSSDKAEVLSRYGWWLKKADGGRAQWTTQYQAWDINITEWAPRGPGGQSYAAWLAHRDYEQFFKGSKTFDIWYFDNAISRPAVKKADWKGTGRDQSRDEPEIAQAYRKGQVAHWRAAAALVPGILLMGNSDDVTSPEYRGQLNAVFLEANIGEAWSIEKNRGWRAMMARYAATMEQTADPHIVGFNVWGNKKTYSEMRYGLASCLMNDGYFSFTDSKDGYRSLPWFDEYDVDLGQPIDPPPSAPWKNNVYKREYQNGLVIVNPDKEAKKIAIPQGFSRFLGGQDPLTNNGQTADIINLPGRDGIILVRVGTRYKK